jgi:uncharacterized repeat protein (TIGR03803 family)
MSKLSLGKIIFFLCVLCAVKAIAAPALTFKTLVRFDGTNGRGFKETLVQGLNGNLYGTTSEGGTGTSSACFHGCGTVFEITPRGKLTTLHIFDGTDGFGPNGLIQATDGNFYGTTAVGGTSSACVGGIGCGTVFSLGVGLGPFVETRPTFGKVGAAVIILGNHLTGATSVTFNGKAATLRVASSTEITTTVPSGATTGPVKVTTPSRTLTSNVNFRVT